MSNGKSALEIFEERIKPTDPAYEAMAQRMVELKELQERGDPAFQPGSRFFASKTGRFVENVLSRMGTTQEPLPLPSPPGDGGYAPLTFAQTEAGVRLAGTYAREEEREAFRHRLALEDTLHELASDLLPPSDVKIAMKQVQRGEVVKSKMAFQAVLQALSDRQEIEFRMAELKEREEAEARTLRQARARIFVNMVGKDVGRSVLFALGAGS